VLVLAQAEGCGRLMVDARETSARDKSRQSSSSRASPTYRRPAELILVAPLELAGGTGSPARVFTLVGR
jgi:hypothetical protein